MALSRAQVQTLFLGLSQAQVKLEHLIFIDELNSNTHYSTNLDSFTALSEMMHLYKIIEVMMMHLAMFIKINVPLASPLTTKFFYFFLTQFLPFFAIHIIYSVL